MKIGFIGASAGSIGGGVETFIYRIGSELSKRHEVVLFTGKAAGERLLPQIKEARFKVITSFFISRRNILNKIITKASRWIFRIYIRTFDVESYSLYLSMLISPKIKARLNECDVIATFYFRDSILYSNYFSKKGLACAFYVPGDVHLKRFFKIDRSDMYICTSNTRKKYVEDKYGRELDGVVTPGISADYLGRKRAEADNSLSLLFVGRLDKKKGVDKLLEIFAILKQRYAGLKLTIVGDGPERGRIEDIIRMKGLASDVVMAGEVAHSQIEAYYLNATVLVHPSEIESFCMVVLEAMALGLPVVATDLPAIREASEGKAILLAKDALLAWVKEIAHLLDDRALRDEISRKNRDVAARHNWEAKAVEFEAFLSRLPKRCA